MQQPAGSPEYLAAAIGADRADVPHVLHVQARRHLAVEVSLVLNDAGDNERLADPRRHFDGLCGTLVRVDPSEEEQVVAFLGIMDEFLDLDAVVDSRQVRELLVPIRVAD